MFMFLLAAFLSQFAFCDNRDLKRKQIDELNKRYGMRFLSSFPINPLALQDIRPGESLLVCKNRAIAYSDKKWNDIVTSNSCNFPEYDEYYEQYKKIENS